jgi:hypothetical protein
MTFAVYTTIRLTGSVSTLNLPGVVGKANSTLVYAIFLDQATAPLQVSIPQSLLARSVTLNE